MNKALKVVAVLGMVVGAVGLYMALKPKKTNTQSMPDEYLNIPSYDPTAPINDYLTGQRGNVVGINGIVYI